MKQIKIIITFILLTFLFEIVSSTPPDLPVLIYGKVENEDGAIMEGVIVTARWARGALATKTLTQQEAINLGDPDSKGYYIIKINNLDPTTLRLDSMNAVIEFEVNPGDVVNKNIILSNKGFFGKIADFFKGIFTGGGPEMTNFSNSREYISEDIQKVTNYDYNLSETQENFSESNDVDSKSNVNTTENLGNGEGGYGDYGETQEPTKSSGETGPYDKTLKLPKEPRGFIYPSFDYFFGEKAKQRRGYIFYLTIAITAAIIISLLITVMTLIKKLVKYLSKRFENTLDISIEGIIGLSSGKFMEKQISSLSPDSAVMDAIDLFVEKNLTLIPVLVSKKVVGIITKKYLLSRLTPRGFDALTKMKVKEVMLKKWISCKPDTSMGDVYTSLVKDNSNGLIIEDKGELVGVIDYFDILNVFHKANFEFDNPPILGEAMNKSVIVADSKIKLNEIESILNDQNSEYVLIEKYGKPGGIVTTKDLISALKKDLDFKKTKAENIMSSNLISMTPGTSVYEAFKIALERKFNQIPIILDGEFIGLVHVKYLVKVYYDLILSLNKKMKKDISDKSVIQKPQDK